MADKLQLLRAKYLESITAKEAEIRILREKLKLLDELDEEAQKITPGSSQSNGKLKYDGVKLTKSIFDAVQTIGRNGGIPATDVRKYIAANGYKHPSKNFNVAVVIALNRLAEQGRINSVKTEDGSRLFSIKM